MSLIVKESTGTAFNPAPEGLHRAVCVDVVDRGEVSTPYGNKRKCLIVWQIDEIDPATGERFVVKQQYGLSLAPLATLRKVCESWRGREFSDTELQGFDLEKLIGAPVQLQIVHKVKDGGRTFANVQAAVPDVKGLPPLQPLNYQREVVTATDQPETVEELPF